MQQLNLPLYNFRIKNLNNKVFIFDNQRKKYVTLTPEEWVRQNFIHFLITELHYPAALIAVDKQLIINLNEEQELRTGFKGLRVGNMNEANNNAGNWE